MKQWIVYAAATAILTVSNTVISDSNPACEYELKPENYVIISITIAEHALKKHADDFVKPAEREAERNGKTKKFKFPWSLKDENELGQFIEDILNKRDVSSIDDKTPLNVLSKELANDRVAWIELNTDTFVVFEPSGSGCGSAYRDNFMKRHYDKQT
jgi:hypothetical protein